MAVHETAIRQRQAIVNNAARMFRRAKTPPEGWIATVRKAIRMSGPQLAARLGVSRARVSDAEHTEAEGRVTLNTMRAYANAMGCRFVYAIVPERKIEDVVLEQATKKASAIVGRASQHMALEAQSLSDQKKSEQVKRLANNLLSTLPSDLWASE